MEPDIDPDEDPNDPGWYVFDEEDQEPETFYRVRFAVGHPVDLEEASFWTTLCYVNVYADAHDAFVSWVREMDPVEETEWATRIAMLSMGDPWAAAWEYVDWDVKRRLRPFTWRELSDDH